jgi:glycosyltransferase involved in cell wall biosynthesis
MRILHVTDRAIPPKPSEGGAPHSLDALRLAQIDLGDEPIVASTVSSELPESVYLGKNKNGVQRLLDAISDKQIDIVHFHAGAEHWQPILEQESVPSVAHVRALRSPAEAPLQNAIYVSRTHAKRHGGSVYVHNGIDPTRYPFTLLPNRALAFLGKVKRKKKGAATAIDIARGLKMPLWLMGGRKLSLPSTWLPMSRLINVLGVAGHDEKVSYVGSALGLLFPIQWEEPFGLVLIEAMACGTPVIAFNRGAVSEIIEHGKTGFIVETADQMAEAVGSLDQIDRLDCRRHVETNFTIEKTAREVKQCYERVLQGDRW